MAIWVIGGFAAFDQLDVASDTVDTLFETVTYNLGLILLIKFAVGDRVRASGVAGVAIDGTVVEIHPTTIELDCDGRSLLVPNSQLLDVVVERVRST